MLRWDLWLLPSPCYWWVIISDNSNRSRPKFLHQWWLISLLAAGQLPFSHRFGALSVWVSSRGSFYSIEMDDSFFRQDSKLLFRLWRPISSRTFHRRSSISVRWPPRAPHLWNARLWVWHPSDGMLLNVFPMMESSKSVKNERKKCRTFLLLIMGQSLHHPCHPSFFQPMTVECCNWYEKIVSVWFIFNESEWTLVQRLASERVPLSKIKKPWTGAASTGSEAFASSANFPFLKKYWPLPFPHV